VFYFGRDVAKFADAFNEIGTVYETHKTPPAGALPAGCGG
jgi:hypothetical protein